jgi:adenylate cyclase, class 2
MNYEVELKFPIPDLPAFARQLSSLHAKVSAPQEEVDLYLAHPSRDFAQTDEALRLRRRSEANFITYKGPKIDSTTKTRREIELPLGSGTESLASWQALLAAVGFRPVAEVRKLRRKAHVTWQGHEIEVSLDDVRDVGTYVEFELVVAENEVELARVCIQSLAQSFGLTQGERRSYLSLLLKGK